MTIESATGPSDFHEQALILCMHLEKFHNMLKLVSENRHAYTAQELASIDATALWMKQQLGHFLHELECLMGFLNEKLELAKPEIIQ